MVTKLAPATVIPLGELAGSWLLALEAEHKSPATLRAYRRGVDAFLAWHAGQGTAEPLLDRPAATAFLADLRRDGQAPATLRLRYKALRLFAAWLAEEGETGGDTLAGLKPPKLDEPVVPRLPEGELTALVAACRGPGFTDRRDEALVRLMANAGLRAAEALGLTEADVSLRAGEAVVRRGKGGKGRRVAFGPETVRALDRYLRLRRRHPLAHTAPLWLPGAGRPTFGYQGLAAAIGARAQAAGIEGFTLHRLRHTWASKWLRAGGSPTALRQAGGWGDLSMVERYTADTAEQQAMEEARKLGLDHIG
jgi:site-specific recombinase XerD